MISSIPFYSYPEANNPSCANCHDKDPHIYVENMINVKANPLSFEVNVNDLNYDLGYMMGAEIVDSAGNIIDWVMHTLKLPIVFEVEKPGKYLIYVGGSHNSLGLTYDSMYVETSVDLDSPEISQVFTHDGVSNKVYVVFDEIVDSVSAESIENYSISMDTEIKKAKRLNDKKTVELEVSNLQPNGIYWLDISNIVDRFDNISTKESADFQYIEPDPDLKIYLPFDEEDGTTAIDYSGNENHGAINKAFREPGIQGKALDFSYKQRFINAGNDESLNLDGDFSISFWFYTERASANYARIFLSARDSFESMDWTVFQTKDSSIELWFGSKGKNKVFQGQDTKADYGKWNHVLVRRQENNFQLWINGLLKGESQIEDIMPTGDNLRVGKMAGDQDNMWGECKMDELRIYGRALIENEIKKLFTRSVEKPRHIYMPIHKDGDTTSFDLVHEIPDGWEPEISIIMGKSIINDQSYFNVYNSQYSNDSILIGYLRQNDDNSKAWFKYIEDENEYLVFDLNLEMGDSISLKHLLYDNEVRNFSIMKVDTFQNRKRIIINYDFGGGFISEYLAFVEGVGPNAFFAFQVDTLNFQHMLFEPFLICKKFINDEHVFQYDTLKDDCVRWISVEDQVDNNSIVIFPNPAAEYIEIKGLNQLNEPSATGVFDITIYNTLGQEVFNSPQTHFHTEGLKVDISYLPSGVYTIVLRNPTILESPIHKSKFVISR